MPFAQVINHDGTSTFILEWDDESIHEDGFVIEYKDGNDMQWTVLDTVDENVTSYGLKLDMTETVLFRIYSYKGSYRSDYSESISSSILSGLENSYDAIMPEEPNLMPNYPNPFNPETTIPFSISSNGPVTIAVYNIQGQLVKTLLDNALMSQGQHQVRWNGKNEYGQDVSSSIYFVTLETNRYHATQRITLAR